MPELDPDLPGAGRPIGAVDGVPGLPVEVEEADRGRPGRGLPGGARGEAPEGAASAPGRWRPGASLEDDEGRVGGVAVLRGPHEDLFLDLAVPQDRDPLDLAFRAGLALEDEPDREGIGAALALFEAESVLRPLAVPGSEAAVLERPDELLIGLDDLQARPAVHDPSPVEPEGLGAEADDLVERVGDDDHRRAVLDEPLHPLRRLAEEVGVPRAEHLVHHEDLGVDGGGGGRGEREAGEHSERVRLERLVEEAPELRELADLHGRLLDLAAVEPLVGERGGDVPRAGQLQVEPGPGVHQGVDLPADLHHPFGRRQVLRQELEHGRLPGAVPADDPEALSPAELEVDPPEGPELPGRRAHEPGEAGGLEEVVARGGEQLVHLARAREGEDDLRHSPRGLSWRARRTPLRRRRRRGT